MNRDRWTVPCGVCRRQSRGFTYTKPKSFKAKPHHACSAKCVEKIMLADRAGFKIQPEEHTALMEGGKMAGEYLEQIGVFDLSKLAKDQWQEFLERVLVGYCADLKRQSDEIPF